MGREEEWLQKLPPKEELPGVVANQWEGMEDEGASTGGGGEIQRAGKGADVSPM